MTAIRRAQDSEGSGDPQPEVVVRRSKRRRRTVTAYRDGEAVVVLIPASMSKREETRWVREMLDRLERSERRRSPSNEQLLARAQTLNDEYLGGLATPRSVRWAKNQTTRWGSCTPNDRSIRVSARLKGMPTWVLDYVLVHELAHLIEPHHDDAFWGWVNHYPRAERARGYLLGWSDAADVDPPASESGIID
jgi:predicted metal-dependent hydrolase